MARTGRALAAGVLAGVLAQAAGGAAPPPRPEEVFQRSYFFDQQTRERIEAAVPTEQKALLEWGGAYVPSYTFFDDFTGHDSHVTVQDLRLWLQMRLDEVHRIYARGLLRYTDWASGDAHGFRAHDVQGMNLEVGYYELDIAGAARRYGGQTWPVRSLFRAGRQYIEVGRGIALAKYLDAGWLQVETKDLALALFGGVTIESEDNLDRSAPGFSRSRRNVYGMQVAYRGIPNHEPYAYLVWQRDRSTERPNDPFQEYRYDSRYAGLGCRGGLGARTQYGVEAIWEFGHSAANLQARGSERIVAYAFDGQLDHYTDWPGKPQFSLEYAHASGDKDRLSATTAVLGNRLGTNDRQFQGFGYLNSGLALGARFSNLQFVRAGARFTPYEDKARLGRLDFGVNYYHIWKAENDGPISDPLAVDDAWEIGQEVDVFAEWRVLSDLSWSVHWGRLFPGGAYASQKPRDFVFTALTFSF